MKLQNIVDVVGGTAQFRIKESYDSKAPVYEFYNQINLENDLTRVYEIISDSKHIRTFDDVILTNEDDVIFSLLSGMATQVSHYHNNYLLTQNFVKLTPKKKIVPRYLIYLLNEDVSIKRQFDSQLQGSKILKYTVTQLKNLNLPKLPNLEKQKIIGDLYFDIIKLKTLKLKYCDLENRLLFQKLKEV